MFLQHAIYALTFVRKIIYSFHNHTLYGRISISNSIVFEMFCFNDIIITQCAVRFKTYNKVFFAIADYKKYNEGILINNNCLRGEQKEKWDTLI